MIGSALALVAPPRRSRRFPRYALLVMPAMLLLTTFFLSPLLLNAVGSMLRPDGGFDASDYVKLLTDPYYVRVIANTIRVSAITTFMCLMVGYPVAYFLARHAGRWTPIVVFLLIAPLLTSTIMRTFGWQVLFARRGPINTALAALGVIERPLDVLQQPIAVYLGLVHVLVPFMVLSISSVLQGIDRRLEESARALGASQLGTFLRVTLPLSLDGVTTGCILTFMIANGSFLTMLLLGGGKVITLPLLIYQQFILTQDTRFASAMGSVLLVVALLCLVLQLRLVKRKGVR